MSKSPVWLRAQAWHRMGFSDRLTHADAQTAYNPLVLHTHTDGYLWTRQ